MSGFSFSALWEVPMVAPSKMACMASSSKWVITWLKASATALSHPFWYSNQKSYLARALTHWCPVASKLGVVMMYVKGLLSVFTRKGWHSRYSLKCSVTAHFNTRNSQLHRMVILLMRGECPAAIGYQVKPSIFLFLGKNCSPIPPSRCLFPVRNPWYNWQKLTLGCSYRLVLMLQMPKEPLQIKTLILISFWLPLQPSAHWVVGQFGQSPSWIIYNDPWGQGKP